MIDYFIRQVPLPRTVEGVTLPNDDGSFDIYINSTLSPEKQDEALKHELRHLKSEHFYLELPIELMERQADGEALNPVLHPPENHIPCFHSEAHLSAWLETVLTQYHIKL